MLVSVLHTTYHWEVHGRFGGISGELARSFGQGRRMGIWFEIPHGRLCSGWYGIGRVSAGFKGLVVQHLLLS